MNLIFYIFDEKCQDQTQAKKTKHDKAWQGQAPVPLSIFRSNSKFDENSKHYNVKYTRPITTIFCTRHDSVTVVSVQNIVVIGRVYSKLKRSEFSSKYA